MKQNYIYHKTKILPTITTTRGSDWREKIKEINKFGIDEVAVFPTCLNAKERKEMYRILEKSVVKEIPFVHIRGDMEKEELDYFIKKWKTKVFNIHTKAEYHISRDFSEYSKMIYIENVYFPLNEKEIKVFGGVCIDFSHMENDRIRHKKKFKHNVNVVKKFPVGCSHIASIRKEARVDNEDMYNKDKERHDFHFLKKLSELDYLENYPLNYFSSYAAIELENSIEEQLEAKDYILNLINKIKTNESV